MSSLQDMLLKVSEEALPKLHELLLSILLKTKNVGAVPVEATKKILELYRDNRLSSKEGILILLEASLASDKDKVVEVLSSLGLQEAASMVKEVE